MDRMLQIALVLVAVVLAGFLVPLLLQLYRTAKAVQALAESAREDLRQISQDIHQVRGDLQRVAGLVEQSLAFPAKASSLAAGLTQSLGTLLGGKASPWVDAVVAVLKLAMDYFKRPREAAPAEGEGR